MRESSITHLQTLTREIGHAIRAHLDRPFALFGHSMGSLVAFELARHLRGELGVEPAHLFVSICRAPQIRGTSPHSTADR